MHTDSRTASNPDQANWVALWEAATTYVHIYYYYSARRRLG